MKRIIFLIFFATTELLSFAQEKDTLHLFYSINKYDVIPFHEQLDSLIATIDSSSKITILAYTDFLGTADRNKKLSEQRAQQVKSYLIQKKSNLNILSCKGKGHINSTTSSEKEKGDWQNRRTDVCILKSNRNSANQKSKIEVIQKKLNELNVGESMPLNDLSFVPGRHVLTYESLQALENLFQELDSSKNIKIEILGHVCCLGKENDGFDFDTEDWHLSVNRAKFIYDFLIKKGIASDRLKFKGLGADHPLVFPEKTAADEQLNRRVEIKILEK